MDNAKTKKTKNASLANASGMHVITYDDLGLDLPKRDISSKNFSQWIRALLQNWRQGTVSVKGRSDVSYSNKKPWKQKGTGRARAGSARSPIWVGGGVTFGPQPRTRVLKTSKDMKHGVLNKLFWNFLEEGNIVSLPWHLQADAPKTSLARKALENAKLHDQKINLFLAPQDLLTYASFANIEGIRIVFFDEPNAYDLVNSRRWVVLEKDLQAFKDMVAKWI